MSYNLPPGFPQTLGQSNPNNFYTSGIAASQNNGTGSQVQANKLNRNKNAAGVTVVPGPVQYVEQPVEVIKKVKKQVYAQTAAPVVQLNQLDPVLRNLIAETSAKVALLIMENNRIKWRISQRDAEIARLRSQGGAGVVRTSGTTQVFQGPSHVIQGQTQVINRGPVTSSVVSGPVVTRPGQVSTFGAPALPVFGNTIQSGVPVNTTVRPAGTTFQGQPR
jgi:hypothetical protein